MAQGTQMSVLSYQGNLMDPVVKWIDQSNGVYSEIMTWWWDRDTHLIYCYINGYWYKFRPMIIRRNGGYAIDHLKQYTAITIP